MNEEIEKALDEIFKEDMQSIRERMKSLMISYDNAIESQVKQDKIIHNLYLEKNKMEKENQELKEDNSHQWEERCRLTFELYKLQKEKAELKERNKYQYELLGKFEKHIDKETIMKIYDEE